MIIAIIFRVELVFLVAVIQSAEAAGHQIVVSSGILRKCELVITVRLYLRHISTEAEDAFARREEILIDCEILHVYALIYADIM